MNLNNFDYIWSADTDSSSYFVKFSVYDIYKLVSYSFISNSNHF